MFEWHIPSEDKFIKIILKEVDVMDIKKAIEYAQVLVKKMQEENETLGKLPTAK